MYRTGRRNEGSTALHTPFSVYEISTTVKLERPEKHSGHPLVLWPDSHFRSIALSGLPRFQVLEVRRTKNEKQERKTKERKSAEFLRESKEIRFWLTRIQRKRQGGESLRERERERNQRGILPPSIFTKLCASISNLGVSLLYEKVVKLIKNPATLSGARSSFLDEYGG